MNLHDFHHLLELPAAQLIRARNGAMILGFFHRAFKQGHRLSIQEGELRAFLESHLDELRHEQLFLVEKSAAEYLDEWCGPHAGWLKKYYPDATTSGEAVFELTSAAEKALLWIESLIDSGFVGTESRLERIFSEVREILTLSTRDPKERLRVLREDAQRIEHEIARIESTGEVETLSPVLLNERFHWLLATSRELLGDFRQVEENFKAIGLEVAERHTAPDATRGVVLGHMLDAYEVLRQSPQGESFYAFWRLLLAQDRQDEFRAAVERAYELEELAPELKANRLLNQLLHRLLDEGQKVVKSNERMAGNLRRVLETTRLGEHRHMRELIREIQTAALRCKEQPPLEEDFFEIDDSPRIFATMSRDPWQPGAELSAILAVEVDEGEDNRDKLLSLRNQPHIEIAVLRRNVESVLSEKSDARLDEILEVYPLKYGVLEVLGYVAVALSSERHLVSENRTQVLLMPPDDQRWRVPMILFSREAA